ncbi:unnamed protein product [Clonostachys rosea f. rosea IK726]|nr:unnamed protein product [Clonostachys rosea f. rosea IK726]
MRSTHVSLPLRLPRIGYASRRYSVRVLGDSAAKPAVQNVADLKAWPLESGQDCLVEINGWVRNIRKASAVRFVEVSDGSSYSTVQAVVSKEMAEEIRLGAAVRLKGLWKLQSPPQVFSPPPEEPAPTPDEKPSRLPQIKFIDPAPDAREERPKITVPVGELQVDEVQILGASDPDTYPIQRKYTSPETLRNWPHLRMRTNLNSTLLRLRSDTIGSLSKIFNQENFIQTHPPIITSADCEGAGEAFKVIGGTRESPFFDSPKFLTVSSQLHLEAMAQAAGNVWTLSPSFRAERSDTNRHLSEFYMLEAEMSFVDDMDEVMDLVQRMTRSLVQDLAQQSSWKELEHARRHPRGPAETRTLEDLDDIAVLERRWNGMLVPEKWPRITYSEAINILEEHIDKFERPPVWGQGLGSEHEKFLAELIGYDKERNAYVPVFVTHYPRDIKAFYMRESAAEHHIKGQIVVDCFDLIAPDIGELAGGSMREHLLHKIITNLRHFSLEASANDPRLKWYVDLRRWGCPPHGGFGIGFDRLLSYLTGVRSIRDLVAFPRLYGRTDC